MQIPVVSRQSAVLALFAVCLLLCHHITTVCAFKINQRIPSYKFSTQLSAKRSWNGISAAVIANIAGLVLSQPVLADLTPAPWDSSVLYEVVKQPTSDVVPVVGDLVTVRFKGTFKDVTFDDTFSTDNPYFYRCGTGLILKGLDDAITHLHIGERVKLRFGGDLSFPNSKPSSPGKPRIPAKATVDYEVELIDVPGKGDDYILDG